ncbi:hypothetical protein SAY87_022277 [Trapa incisa]|uniref:Pentatricopeptide repeat-containing protein n=2 Tax=Trapa TaxID=22665 RepID=A0AAN7QXL2_TRANT|nr:hypothetical protein SAY87_022277 [Trapa incisa]KAK4782792.1 hypothetical protein SAY86_007166 [Trapa natans]
MKVHHFTYSLLLQECIFRRAYRKAKIIHSQMVVVGYIPNQYLKTKLIILYTKLNDMETAKLLFDKLVTKSLVSWNALIAGYVQKGDNDIALNLYYEIRSNGLSPDQYTFASVLRACSALATLEHGRRVHGILLKTTIKKNVVVSSALVNMYFKCSSLSDGHQVFDKSSGKNIVTWTALISGFGYHGRVLEVLESFNKMKIEGFRPNNVTFLAVLSACSHGGLVEQGWEHFFSMSRDYGIRPTGQHYATMIDLLGRAGRLNEAYLLVLNSPFREHPVIWGALLGACRTHGDIDFLKLAAIKYFELEPENSGKYVVLCNAYAAFGLWDNVAEIRGAMRKWGITKEPGYSSIEVKDEFHVFCQGDKLHRQSEEIYQMIKKITDILKDADYVPDLSPD